MLQLCHGQIYGFRLVFLALSKLPTCRAAFWEYSEPQGLWSKEPDLDFWKSIDPDLPVNLLPDIQDVLLATGPPTTHAEQSISQPSEHQTTIFSQEDIGSHAANWLARSSSPSLGQNYNEPSGDYRQPEDRELPRQKYNGSLGCDQYQSSQTYIAPCVGSFAVDRTPSLPSTCERLEAAYPLLLSSFIGLPRTCDALSTVDSTRKSPDFALQPDFYMNPVLKKFDHLSPKYLLSSEYLIALDAVAGGLQEPQNNMFDCSVSPPQGQISCDSFQDFQRSVSAAKESRPPSYAQSPFIPLKSFHAHSSIFMPEYKRRKISDHAIGQTIGDINSNFPELIQSNFEAEREMHEPHGNTKALSSSETLAQTIANIRDKILNPVEHGYVNSLKSFIAETKSDTIKFTPEKGIWVKETDSKRFLLHWEKEKVPYPPPFASGSLRRKHVKSCFEDIVSKEFTDTEHKDFYDVAQTMCIRLNHNALDHGGIPYNDRLLLKKFKGPFIKKLNFACKVALFLVRAINSIFPGGETYFGRKVEHFEAWVFLKTFLEDFGFFQSDLKQKYTWLKGSMPDSPGIKQLLEDFKLKIARSHDQHDTLAFSWLLAEVWLIEMRPILSQYILAPGGRIDQRLQILFYKYLTLKGKAESNQQFEDKKTI